MAIFALNLPFPAIVLAAAIIGWIGGRWAPQYFVSGGGHDGPHGEHQPALIDDNVVLEHTLFSWSHTLKVAVAGLLLWCIPVVFLLINFGWNHTFTQMSWFFTKAALLTIGGAYAVLPYVYQGAVEFYGWLTPVQMIDGLALGETTPGPLVMVVAYVAFVGGYLQALLGPDALFLAGAAAAALVTWVTFLPSFLFILIGGPLVESARGEIRLTAPLTAITAAVVGVILNLALFFCFHVLWPEGFSGAFDLVSAVFTVAAVVALIRFRSGVITVIAVSAIAGLLCRLLVPALAG